MDTLLLATAGLIAGRDFKAWRLLCGAAAGALLGCMLFFAKLPFLPMVLLKLTIPCALVLIAFSFERLSTYGRTVLVYLAVHLLFGGGMYAFYAFTDAGSHMQTANGVYYMDLPLWLLLLLSFGFYGLTRWFFHLIDRRRERTYLHTLSVDGREMLALLDTGNSLYDPITLTPVILCQWDQLALPEQVLQAALHGDATALPRLTEAFPKLKLRLLPYTDASGARTLLYAYRPREMTVDGKERVGLVGITVQPLAPDGRFQALLHRDWSDL